jgi:hypothetical protein
VSGARFKRGPEDEPAGVMMEAMRWNGLFGRFGEGKQDWWKGLAEVDLPLLAVSAAGDQQDPTGLAASCSSKSVPSTASICLGRQQGFTDDFGHVEMLVSKAAQAEVWPLVARWLKDH